MFWLDLFLASIMGERRTMKNEMIVMNERAILVMMTAMVVIFDDDDSLCW